MLIASPERLLGASLVSLFELKGFPSKLSVDAATLRHLTNEWYQHVVFLDTRIGACGNYAMVRDLCRDDDAEHCLIVAMSGFLPEEPIALFKEAGYDGHCCRPCPVWQMTDLLDEFFACHAVR